MLFCVVPVVLLSVFVGSNCDLASCHLANADVDKVLQQTNYHVQANSHDSLDVEGFNQHIHLTLFGFNIWEVYLELSDGSMYSLATLSRSGDVNECSNSTYKSLEGSFTYDTMEMTFKSMEVTFLSWTIAGKFTYKFKPDINVVFIQTNMDCGPGPLSIQSSGDVEYEIVADDSSWISWLVFKAVHYSLKNADTSPMLSSFIQRSWVSVDCYFGWYYCNN